MSRIPPDNSQAIGNPPLPPSLSRKLNHRRDQDDTRPSCRTIYTMQKTLLY